MSKKEISTKNGNQMFDGTLGVGVNNDSVATPPDFFKELNKEFHFSKFDPCPLNGDPLTGGKFDGLTVDWPRNKPIYVNPPFANIPAWIQKGVSEMEKGSTSIFLIPARTKTKYWKDLVYPNACEIRFLIKGLKFVGFKDHIPVALAIVVFDPKRKPIFRIVTKKTYTYAEYI
jgi:DNA N-6-adenine-methyltransferase (Dam)